MFIVLKELALCTLMKFVELEAQYPLIKVEWKGKLTFPCELLKVSCRAEEFLLPVTGWHTPSPGQKFEARISSVQRKGSVSGAGMKSWSCHAC